MESATVYLGDIALDLTGDYSPAEAETGPSYASGGEPGCDSSFDVTGCEIGGVDAIEVWEALTGRTRDALANEARAQIEANI